MSLASTLGILAYLAALVPCALATRVALRMPRVDAGAVRIWMAACAVLVLAVLARLLGLEEGLRATLRTMLEANGEYGARRSLQMPVVALLAVAVAVVAGLLAYRWSRRRVHPIAWFVRLAGIAMSGFMALFALRVVSYHFTDRLLYGGGLHLNWVLEFVLVAAMGASAMAYASGAAKVAGERGHRVSPASGRGSRRR